MQQSIKVLVPLNQTLNLASNSRFLFESKYNFTILEIGCGILRGKRFPTILICVYEYKVNSKSTFPAEKARKYETYIFSNNQVYEATDRWCNLFYADGLTEKCFLLKWYFFVCNVNFALDFEFFKNTSGVKEAISNNCKWMFRFYKKLTIWCPIWRSLQWLLNFDRLIIIIYKYIDLY